MTNKIIKITSKVGDTKSTRKVGVDFNSSVKTVVDIMSFCSEFSMEKLEKLRNGQSTAKIPFFKYTIDGTKWATITEKTLNSIVSCLNGMAISEKSTPDFFFTVDCEFSPSKNASFFVIRKNAFCLDNGKGVTMEYIDDVAKGGKTPKEYEFAFTEKQKEFLKALSDTKALETLKKALADIQ